MRGVGVGKKGGRVGVRGGGVRMRAGRVGVTADGFGRFGRLLGLNDDDMRSDTIENVDTTIDTSVQQHPTVLTHESMVSLNSNEEFVRELGKSIQELGTLDWQITGQLLVDGQFTVTMRTVDDILRLSLESSRRIR
nr:hypothetical protein [Tanacetum cinerariifolium]